MATRNAEATWQGNLEDGNGTMRLGTGSWEGPYTFKSRFEEGDGTNPEELIGAAQAGCYSMQLAADLARAGHDPQSVTTTAAVHLRRLDEGMRIARIELSAEATVPGISDDDFQRVAAQAKENCLIAKALAGVGEITLSATLT